MSCPAFSFYSLEQWKDFLLICMISPAWHSLISSLLGSLYFIILYTPCTGNQLFPLTPQVHSLAWYD